MEQSTKARLLAVDDDRFALESLADVLRGEGYDVVATTRGAEAIQIIETNEPEISLVLTDLRMREVDGMEILRTARRSLPEVPVILLTAFADMESAFEAIQKGAYDYLSKPFKLDHLRLVVRRALDQSTLRRENKELRSVLETQTGETSIIGRSPEMVEVYKLVAKVAPLPTTVLIQGESGTGKELISRLIHRLSKRRGPLKAINCGALSESLLESELFGYVRGAFTGAVTNKKGIFESAHLGTCLLDEISSMTPSLQSKLLRVLEEREVLPVGSTEPVSVDVRIIAATNHPLSELVDSREFREDLFYRLKVVTIDLPPLRERKGDIPLLLDHFVRHYAAASTKTIAVQEAVYAVLARYSWPGNVRELQNAVERAIALNTSGLLTTEDFPDEIREAAEGAAKSIPVPSPFKLLEDREFEYVQEVLQATGDNVSEAARILGIDRRTVYRILERHGVKRSED